MFRLTVLPDSCGRKVWKSVALRMPNFSMSAGRYVSTGFGPISSAVGMFEPVTTTRSNSAVAPVVTGAADGEGFWPDVIDTDKSAIPTLAAKATPAEQALDTNFTNFH
jgi:hypothetical protein